MTEKQKYKKATYHMYTFLVSKLIGSLGNSVFVFGLSMYVLATTGSAFKFAMVILCSLITQTILSPIAGVVGDRVSRKLLVVGGQAGLAAVAIGLAIYTILNGLSMPAIYVGAVLIAVCNSFSGIAISASIANLIDEGRLQKAMSFNQLAASSAGIGGPILGGILFGFASIEVFLIIFAVTNVIALSLESTMNFNLYKKELPKAENAKKETMVQSFTAGFRYVKTKPIIMALLSATFAINFFFTSLSVGGDFTLVALLKMPAKYIGFTEAAAAVGVILASIYFAASKQVENPLKFSKYSLLIMATLLMLPAIPLIFTMNLLGNFIFFLALMLLFGVVNVAINMPIGVLFQSMVSDEFRSRVFGIISMASMSLMPLATLIYGVLFDVVPAEYLFIVSGLCLIVVTLITFRPSVIAVAYEETLKIRAASEAEKEAAEQVEEITANKTANAKLMDKVVNA